MPRNGPVIGYYMDYPEDLAGSRIPSSLPDMWSGSWLIAVGHNSRQATVDIDDSDDPSKSVRGEQRRWGYRTWNWD